MCGPVQWFASRNGTKLRLWPAMCWVRTPARVQTSCRPGNHSHTITPPSPSTYWTAATPEGIEWMQAREEHRQTLLLHTVMAGHQAWHERPNQARWLSTRQQWTPYRYVPRHDHALAQKCWREIYKIMLSQLNLACTSSHG